MVVGSRSFGDYLLLLRPTSFLFPLILGFLFSITIYTLAMNYVNFVKSFLIGLVLGILHMSCQPINQIYDIDVDKINKPNRPLVRGVISVFEAWFIGVAFLIFSLLLSAIINQIFLFSVSILGFFAYFYSVPPIKIKRRGAFTSLIWLALSKGFLPIVLISFSIAGKILLESIALGIIFFLWVFATQPSKDFNDFKGDRLVGIKTLPTVYGYDKAIKFVRIFMWFPFVALTVFIVIGLLSIFFALIYLVIPLNLYAFIKIKELLKKVSIENNDFWLIFYIGYIFLASLSMISAFFSKSFSSL